jgi:hypothetical protein
MDGRPHPSPNALHREGSFATGEWEGDTLRVRMTHLKTAWIRRGVGIPGSDHSTITMFLTRRDNLLTATTIQEDPYYLTEPHVVSRIYEWNPTTGGAAGRPTCNTANIIDVLEDTGDVPHYLPGENPEEDYMTRLYNLPREAALGYTHTLYPEYRKTLRNVYEPPASCTQYCCGWIERQGFPGGAPNLECRDGGSELFERFR